MSLVWFIVLKPYGFQHMTIKLCIADKSDTISSQGIHNRSIMHYIGVTITSVQFSFKEAFEKHKHDAGVKEIFDLLLWSDTTYHTLETAPYYESAKNVARVEKYDFR